MAEQPASLRMKKYSYSDGGYVITGIPSENRRDEIYQALKGAGHEVVVLPLKDGRYSLGLLEVDDETARRIAAELNISITED